MTEQEYDLLYDDVVNFLKEVNPCKIENGFCLRGKMGGGNFCCGGKDLECDPVCKHCSPSGCTAEKPLPCKLWLCREVEKSLTNNQWKILTMLRARAGALGSGDYFFRTTKSEIFEEYNSNKGYYDSISAHLEKGIECVKKPR